MEGLQKGEGLILSMYPLTSCIVLQAMCMIASSRCVCACVCVCVPTYWQLRDLNSLLFSLIFICYSPVLLSSCPLFPILSSHLFLSHFPSLYLISSFCPFPLSFLSLLLFVSSPPPFFTLRAGFVLLRPKKISHPCHCLECNALSISIPLCSLHFTSSGCGLRATHGHAAHVHTHACWRSHVHKHAVPQSH